MKDRSLKRGICMVALACAFIGGGCAGPRAAPTVVIDPEAPGGVLLPAPPATPRVRYLYSVKGPQEERRPRAGDMRWIGDEPEEPQRFRSPIAIAGGHEGLFYVADQANSMLLAFEPEKRGWKFIEPDAGEPLASLVGLAVDVNGAVYLTDSALRKVFRLRDGGAKADAFAGDYPFGRPTGIAFNPANKGIYVVDTLANRVLTFDLSGKKLLEFGQRGEGEGEFNYPTYIAADRQGNLYVSDSMNFRVQSFTATGVFRFTFGSHGSGPGQFAGPKGVAISSEGLMYVVDGPLDKVQAFSLKGEYLFSFGTSGSDPGQFWLPNGIHVDGKGRVYVCDYLNGRVQVFLRLGANGS